MFTLMNEHVYENNIFLELKATIDVTLQVQTSSLYQAIGNLQILKSKKFYDYNKQINNCLKLSIAKGLRQ